MHFLAASEGGKVLFSHGVCLFPGGGGGGGVGGLGGVLQITSPRSLVPVPAGGGGYTLPWSLREGDTARVV